MKKVLQQSSVKLDRLLQHSRYLEYLSKRLLTYLPVEFAKKISVLGFSSTHSKTEGAIQQTLIVAAASPAWASKLRFYIPALKRSLCAEAQFSQLNKITVRTSPCDVSLKKNTRKPIYSPDSAAIIQDSAQHINNTELKEALIRLAHSVNRSLS